MFVMNLKIHDRVYREGVLAAAGGLLVGDELVALHGDGGLALPAVSRLLIELLSKPGVKIFY